MSTMHNDNTPPKRAPLPFTHTPATQAEIDAVVAKLPGFTNSERAMMLMPNTYVGSMFHSMTKLTWRDMFVLHRALQQYKENVK